MGNFKDFIITKMSQMANFITKKLSDMLNWLTLSKGYGERSKADDHSNESATMKHKEMFLEHIVRPFSDAFTGMLEYFLFKVILVIGSFPALLRFDLFETPQLWWKGLMWLVLLDWIGGVVSSIWRGDFDWHLMARKWYMATGYTIVCSMGAILSNTFPNVFWFVQYVVYATFFLKEFVSTLKTFRVLAMFKVMWEAFIKRRMDIERFDEFKQAVEDHSESHPHWPREKVEEHEEN